MPAEAAPQRRRHGPAAGAALVLLAVAGVLLVLSLHGFWPGMSQPALQTLLSVGDVSCLRAMGAEAFVGYCDRVGAPLGRPFLTGLPQLYTTLVLSWLPAVDVWRAHQLANVLTDLLGLLGGYGLARRWLAPRAVAVVAAVGYLASPSILLLNGFAFTFAGYVLLPLYLLLLLRSLDAAAAGRWAGLVAPALVVPAVALFTDGYSFVGLALAVGVLGAGWLVRPVAEPVRKAAAAGSWALGVVLAYLLYSWYAPEGAEELQVGLGAFRSLGLDVVTLVVPQGNLWWTAASGTGTDLSWLWGDGSNIGGNYAGFVALVLTGWLVLRARRLLPDGAAGEVRSVALLAVLALALSLGPALKVADPAVPLEPAWDVPVSLVTAPLPTAWLYENVPGLDVMRATYRWFTVTRLALVVLGAVAAGALWRTGRRAAAVVLLVLAWAEPLVDVPAVWAAGRAEAEHVEAVRWEVLPSARALLEPGERVLALPASNDFMAAVVFASTGTTTYNAGPDRNARLAAGSWPAPVARAAAGLGTPEQNDLLCGALLDEVDAVVLPRFSLYAQALRWPPPAAVVADADARAATVSADPRFAVTRDEHLVVVRDDTAAPGGGCAGPAG